MFAMHSSSPLEILIVQRQRCHRPIADVAMSSLDFFPQEKTDYHFTPGMLTMSDKLLPLPIDIISRRGYNPLRDHRVSPRHRFPLQVSPIHRFGVTLIRNKAKGVLFCETLIRQDSCRGNECMRHPRGAPRPARVSFLSYVYSRLVLTSFQLPRENSSTLFSRAYSVVR